MISTSAKASLCAWWIQALLSLFLWYRNNSYDRIIAVFLFVSGLIQLVEYGALSGADPRQTGTAIFLVLWLQCLVLNIAALSFFVSQKEKAKSFVTVSSILVFIYALMFLAMLIYSFFPSMVLKVEEVKNKVLWTKNGKEGILGNLSIVYLLGIFVPLFLILAYYSWANLEMGIIILYLLGTLVFSLLKEQSLNSWGNFFIGVGFLAWFFGGTEVKNTSVV